MAWSTVTARGPFTLNLKGTGHADGTRSSRAWETVSVILACRAVCAIVALDVVGRSRIHESIYELTTERLSLERNG